MKSQPGRIIITLVLLTGTRHSLCLARRVLEGGLIVFEERETADRPPLI